MIVRHFFETPLAQASYLIGCPAVGEAIVIDPARDIRPYLETANALGLKIVAVTETHIHADFLSGSRELAHRTGAQIYLSGAGGPDWQYAYAEAPNVTLLSDGDRVKIGGVNLQTLHTPGHTPEHIAFLLSLDSADNRPHSLFSGDFVFVGDVGRPDLLERTALVAGSMEDSARNLFRSLGRLAELPDSLLIWPGHGAGSSCGKALGDCPVTTLGYERATNWAFLEADEDRFVTTILSGQPAPPTYFREMKRMNQAGPALAPEAGEVPRRQSASGQLVDVRSGAAIRAGSARDAIALPHGRAFTGWAGWTIDYVAPITLVCEDQTQADRARRDLASIGLDNIHGWIRPSDLAAERTGSLPGIAPSEIVDGDVVLDVREDRERAHSHVKGSHHIPYGRLAERLSEVPTEGRIVVYCAAGSRSLIACSLLRRAGFRDVCELTDGLSAIEASRPEILV